MDGARRPDGAARVRRHQPARLLVGSRTLRARVPRSGRARLRPPPAAFRAADRARRDSRDVRVLAAGRDRDAAARGRPAASPVPDCEWQRRLGDLTFDLDGTPSTRTLAAYERALTAPSGCLQRADEARLGAWLGAIALGVGRAADALPLLDRALARGDAELTTLANRAVALEALGRTADAAAAWTAVIARAGDSTSVGAGARAPRPAARAVGRRSGRSPGATGRDRVRRKEQRRNRARRGATTRGGR